MQKKIFVSENIMHHHTHIVVTTQIITRFLRHGPLSRNVIIGQCFRNWVRVDHRRTTMTTTTGVDNEVDDPTADE